MPSHSITESLCNVFACLITFCFLSLAGLKPAEALFLPLQAKEEEKADPGVFVRGTIVRLFKVSYREKLHKDHNYPVGRFEAVSSY